VTDTLGRTPPADEGSTAPTELAAPSVTELVARIMEEVTLGAASPLDRLCSENPTLADELRARVRRLEALGLLGGDAHEGPARVGPFTIVGKLGQGGMGEVFLGQQAYPVRRMVAVKVMRGGAHAGSLMKRFEAERQALATLNHPGIAQVLEAGTDEQGQPWFAMEYVDGPKITDYCDEHGLDLDARIELFLQVCNAVADAHANGILHRDLKPGNVLVTERGGRPLVKVIDFGLAKATEVSDLDASLLTETGQLLGTPAYMSPEQAGALPGRIDPRTDVYALGVMLYVLLVGRVPLSPRGRDVHPMLQMQRLLRDAVLVRPSQRVGEMPEGAAAVRGESTTSWSKALAGDLDWIVSRALARHQVERYAAVSELAADLRRHLRKEVVLAGPPSTAYRVSRFLQRHRREAVAAGIVATVSLVVLVVGTVIYLRDQEAQLANFDVLEREMRLGELLQESVEELWPSEPYRIAEMEAWRAEAAEMVEQRERIAGILVDVESRGETTAGVWSFAQPRDHALHASVLRLLEGLDALAAEDGALEDMDDRIAWAADLERLTLEEPAQAWANALADIADPSSCPAYAGLEIGPQLGLVPLARNDATGLWEFAVPRPGTELPTWGGDRWLVTERCCPIFVLLPGGSVQQGAQSVDPSLPNYFYAPNREEQDGRLVTLDPFFLSKYELSQAQYGRAMGANPSATKLPVHPVEQIDWLHARMVCRRLGLVLPTGAQWEYGARSLHPSPWWTGPSDVVPEGCGNLADAVFLASEGREAAAKVIDESYYDGYVNHAPVDAFRPNAFGLHNVIGNVWEWCLDPARAYALVMPRAGDGLQVPLPDTPPPADLYELRGGSFRSAFNTARSTFRHSQPMASTNVVYGVRPARPIRTHDAGDTP
jgi:serine/threonine protein kinase